RLNEVGVEIAQWEAAAKARRALAEQTRETWEPQLRRTTTKPAPTTQGLLIHFPLDEKTAELAEVSATAPSIKAKVNGKAIPTTGPLNGALQFDGATTLELDKGQANFGRTDKFSYGAWINSSS